MARFWSTVSLSPRRASRAALGGGLALFGGLLSVALMGCVGAAKGSVERLVAREVAWNPGGVDVGHVAGVADVGAEMLVVGDQGAFFFAEGALAGTDRRSSSWVGAAVIPSAEGKGSWLAAIDGAGALYRVRARSGLVEIGSRYGVSGTPVLGAAALGQGLLALALGGGRLGVADGREVTIFARADGSGAGILAVSAPARAPRPGRDSTPGTSAVGEQAEGATLRDVAGGSGRTGEGEISGGGGKVAWVEEGGIRVFDPVARKARWFELPGVRRAALDEDGRLVAATSHALYGEDATGNLVLAHETPEPRVTITGLAVSGSRAWFSEGGKLGLLTFRSSPHAVGPTSDAPSGSGAGAELGFRVAITLDLEGSAKGRLLGSPSGDVWSLAGGRLSRFTTKVEARGPTPERFRTVLAPVIARACASCHGPDGSSGIDLSTLEAWELRRASIRYRVLVALDMPPRTRPMSDADRQTISDWLALER